MILNESILYDYNEYTGKTLVVTGRRFIEIISSQEGNWTWEEIECDESRINRIIVDMKFAKAEQSYDDYWQGQEFLDEPPIEYHFSEIF